MQPAIIPPELVINIAALFNNYAGTGYKDLTLYFQPNATYADSSVRAFRKGGGFLGMGAPEPSARPDEFHIKISFRPGVMLDGWAGYTFNINNDGTGTVAIFRYWPENPEAYARQLGAQPNDEGEFAAEYDADPALLPQIVQHLEALLQLPVTTEEPPREAPSTMY